MRYFSVPADFREETIDSLAYLNSQYNDSKIIEVYGQKTTGNILSSGRVTKELPQIDDEQFYSYIRKAKEKNIEFNYTLNPSCFGNFEFQKSGIHQIQALIYELEEHGINSLTLTSPAIMELCKETSSKIKIKVSAICEVNSPMKSMFYENMGVDRIVVDPDITRDFRKLKNICKSGKNSIEIIVNNVCMRNCAYKMFHYNHEAHCTKNSDQEIRDYFTNRCSLQKAQSVENVIKLNWIRPEDIKFYEACGIKHFKLQGRQNVLHGDLLKTLEAYFDQSYEGNLFDLITLFSPYNSFQCNIDNKKLNGFIKYLYENENFCTENCKKCKYCTTYAQKSINLMESKRLNEKATDFFKSVDAYKNILQQPKVENIDMLKLESFNFNV